MAMLLLAVPRPLDVFDGYWHSGVAGYDAPFRTVDRFTEMQLAAADATAEFLDKIAGLEIVVPGEDE
jgi:hypothetical protein